MAFAQRVLVPLHDYHSVWNADTQDYDVVSERDAPTVRILVDMTEAEFEKYLADENPILASFALEKRLNERFPEVPGITHKPFN